MESITICVKIQELNKVGSIFKEDENIQCDIDILANSFNTYHTFYDFKESHEYAEKFLTENNLEEDNVFLREFDITPYPIAIDFHVGIEEDINKVYLLISKIAKKMSTLLCTSCLLMENLSEVPIALYTNGELEKQWKNDIPLV
ncbi:MAG: hypothetical protein BGO31_07940 [Bacteroidetes bacterium 43-16]|nr:MAG: hypothetical protein BGO31_07940 [Bacteroidetes bacterium 43-16]